MKYEIWAEGFVTNGEQTGARFHGTFEADSFAKACDFWARTLPSEKHFDRDRLTYWGCRLFDNEIDARRSFG
jgi:hypothetical protein